MSLATTASDAAASEWVDVDEGSADVMRDCDADDNLVDDEGEDILLTMNEAWAAKLAATMDRVARKRKQKRKAEKEDSRNGRTKQRIPADARNQ
jgi:hypothetical protein